MPTPPRKIEQLTAQRAPEITALLNTLENARDLLRLAQVYAEEGGSATAGERLNRARLAVIEVLTELNTFLAVTPAAKRNGAAAPDSAPEVAE